MHEREESVELLAVVEQGTRSVLGVALPDHFHTLLNVEGVLAGVGAVEQAHGRLRRRRESGEFQV